MKSDVKKNLLLINGLSVSRTILNEFLSKKSTDSNIYLSFPLGSLTLAAWCKQEFPNFNIRILDEMINLHKYISNNDKLSISIDSFIKNTLNEINFTPDFIGISIICSNGHNSCLDIARLCKEKWPESKVIVGGMHVTSFTHKIIDNKNVDYAIRGAGDVAFVELLEALIQNKNFQNINGVIANVNDISSFACPIENLDLIPSLPYELIDMEYLIKNDSTSPIKEEGTRIAPIFMSRGCPFGCTFCSADKIHGKKVLFINVIKIVDVIEYLINKYKINTICIMDDLFGADKKYFADFFKLIEERKLKFKIVIPGGLNINVFNEEMIDIIIRHGMNMVTFPLESGSKYVQNNIIKKRVDLDKAARLIKYSQKKGLFTGINIVFGLPGETRKLIYETYDFIKKLPVDWIAFFLAYPYPGTEMTRILLDRGDLTEESLMQTWELSSQSFKERPFDTKEFTGKELSKLVYDFNIELNFFNNYNLRNKNYSKFIIKLDKVIDRFPFHVVALACRAKAKYELNDTEQAKKDLKEILNLKIYNLESQKMFEHYKISILNIINFGENLIEDFNNKITNQYDK